MGCICPSNGKDISSISNFKQKWKDSSIINATQVNLPNLKNIKDTHLQIKKPFHQLTSKESWNSIIHYLSPTDMPVVGKCNKTFNNIIKKHKRHSHLFSNNVALLGGMSQDFPKQITLDSNISNSSNKLLLSNIPKSNNLYSINSNTNFTLNSNRSNVIGLNNQKQTITFPPEKKPPALNVVTIGENSKDVDIGFRSNTSNSGVNLSDNNNANSGSSNTINNSKAPHYFDFFTNKRLNISNNGSRNQNITFSNASLSIDKTVSFSENTVVNQKNITNVTNITTINVTPVIIQAKAEQPQTN